MQSTFKPQTPLSWWAEVAVWIFTGQSLLLVLPRHGFLPSGPQRAFLFLFHRINKVLSVSSQEREEPCSALKMRSLSVSQREPCCLVLANTKIAKAEQINIAARTSQFSDISESTFPASTFLWQDIYHWLRLGLGVSLPRGWPLFIVCKDGCCLNVE